MGTPRLFFAVCAMVLLVAGIALPAAAQTSEPPPAAPSSPAEPAPSAPPPVQSLESDSPAPSQPPAAETPAKADTAATSATLSPEQFREQLVGVPLCGVPPTGPLAGKVLCTVHLPDGIAVVAGSGVLVRGLWEISDGQVCRRSKDDPLERRRCVTYERVSDDRYKNSDGVEVCRGPCGQ